MLPTHGGSGAEYTTTYHSLYVEFYRFFSFLTKPLDEDKIATVMKMIFNKVFL